MLLPKRKVIEMSVYSSYNSRELMMAQKATKSAITRVQNDRRAVNRGNQITRLTKTLRAIEAEIASR